MEKVARLGLNDCESEAEILKRELAANRDEKGTKIMGHKLIFVLEGVTQAVDEFIAETPEAVTVPIGDYVSLAIIKP